MADGLLSNILNFIDQKKQSTMAGLGLLANNPQEYFTGRAEQLRDFNRAQEAGLLADRSQMRGLPVTPEQQMAQQYAQQQLQDLTLGFTGSVGNVARKLPLTDMGEISKFTKPLPSGQLYRETSSSNLMDLFKGNTPFGSPVTYFSEVPEMALGQGANKGVMIKVNSEGLKGRPFLGKPGLEQAYLQKAGEFEIKEQPNNIIKAINEVWVSPAAYKDLRKAEVVLFNKQLSDLEKSGVKVNKVDKLPNTLD
jgi:hypothetical protein